MADTSTVTQRRANRSPREAPSASHAATLPLATRRTVAEILQHKKKTDEDARLESEDAESSSGGSERDDGDDIHEPLDPELMSMLASVSAGIPAASAAKKKTKKKSLIRCVRGESAAGAPWQTCKPVAKLSRRIHRYLEDLDVMSAKLFTSVVVRIPLPGLTADDVLQITGEFGPAEYCGPVGKTAADDAAVDVAEDRQVTDPTEAALLAALRREGVVPPPKVGDAHSCADVPSHLVQFRYGHDAIRFFLAVNGGMLDPRLFEDVIQQVIQNVVNMSAKQLEGTGTTPEVLAARVAKMAEDALMPTVGEGRRGAPSFMTCDFFRAGFVIDSLSGECPARMLLATRGLNSKTPAAVRVHTTPPRGQPATAVSPSLNVHRALARQADELRSIHRIVSSYGDRFHWDDYCRCAATVAFLHGTPSQKSYFALSARRDGQPAEGPTPLAALKRRLHGGGHFSHFSVTEMALGRTKEFRELQDAIDRADSLECVATGLARPMSLSERATNFSQSLNEGSTSAAVLAVTGVALVVMLLWILWWSVKVAVSSSTS